MDDFDLISHLENRADDATGFEKILLSAASKRITTLRDTCRVQKEANNKLLTSFYCALFAVVAFGLALIWCSLRVQGVL